MRKLSKDNREWVQRNWDADYIDLCEEHGELTMRKIMDGALSERQAFRLSFVKFKLDAIEDAICGPALDEMESLLSK